MADRRLCRNPTIHASARVVDSILGPWTEIGPNTQLVESELGDYSYAINDCDIIYAKIGKFCSLASHVRINPGNHPLNRPALHHFTYESADLAYVSRNLGKALLGGIEFFKNHHRNEQVVLFKSKKCRWIMHQYIGIQDIQALFTTHKGELRQGY